MSESDVPKAESSPVSLRLYLADHARASQLALTNLREILAQLPAQRFTLEVVDALVAPGEALGDGVVLTPCLVRLGKPVARLSGVFNDRSRVLDFLNGRDGGAPHLEPERVSSAAALVARTLEEMQSVLGEEVDMVLAQAGEVPIILPGAQHVVWDCARNFRGIFEKAPIGIALLSRDFRFLSANASLSLLTGYTESELLAMHLADLTGEGWEGVEVTFEGKVKACELGFCEGECTLAKKGGEVVWLRFSVALMQEDVEASGYFLVMVQDITEMKRAASELHRYQNRLEELVRGRTDELAGANQRLMKEIEDRLAAEEAVRALNEELEARVSERTAELEETNRQLETMNHFFVGRELRMAELKNDIDKLEQEVRALKHGKMEESSQE